MRKISVTLSTGAGGAGTATTSRPVAGCIYGIYIDVGTLAATGDITFTQSDGIPVLVTTNVSASGWYFPVISATHYTGAGTPLTDGDVPVVGYLTAVIASGGASTSGTITYFVEE